VSAARDRLNQANSDLLSIGTMFVQASSTASEARSSLSSDETEAYATAVDAMITQLRDSANSQFDGAYIFSGDAVQTAPYPPGSAQAAYAGSAASQSVPIPGRSDIQVLYTGDQVFHPTNRQATFYIGDTGAKAGTGTDSSVGRGVLTVKHTSTTYAAGSGVTAGTSSVDGDTIIGPAGSHTLTIKDTSGTGASGTISIDGGPEVAFTNGDTNLKVEGTNGQVVYVNTSSITAGFNGDVAVTGNGSLSRDGGATSVPIDFTTAQAVTDADGRVTFVDSTGITKPGTEQLEFTGTGDAFQALVNLRDDLRNTRGLSNADWQAALTRDQDDLDRIHNHILSVTGSQAQTLKTLDDLDTRFDNLTLDSQQRIADVSATDIPAAATELQGVANLLQYSYAVTAQIFKTSLLDYLA
jgi:flagellin-like hook-associated protein FlgL